MEWSRIRLKSRMLLVLLTMMIVCRHHVSIVTLEASFVIWLFVLVKILSVEYQPRISMTSPLIVFMTSS